MLQVYILNGGKLWNTVLCNWIEEKANNRKTYMKNKTKIIPSLPEFYSQSKTSYRQISWSLEIAIWVL